MKKSDILIVRMGEACLLIWSEFWRIFLEQRLILFEIYGQMSDCLISKQQRNQNNIVYWIWQALTVNEKQHLLLILIF